MASSLSPLSPSAGRATAAPAVIHDVRYSRFTGELRSRPWSVLALAQSSFTRALGIRRSAGAKVWPFLLIIAVFLPAIIAVGVPLIVTTVDSPLDVLTLPRLLSSTSIVILAYAATTLPSLLTRERRDRVLTLYFSTAVSPAEYIVAKILAALELMLLVTFGPLLLVLVGGIVVADHPMKWAQDHAGDFPRAFLAALIVASFHTAFGLALGALTNRRVFAVGGYVALMLVPAGMGLAFYVAVSRNDEQHGLNFLALNLLADPVSLARHVLPNDPDFKLLAPSQGVLLAVWVAAIVFGVGTLLKRYHSGRES